MVQVCDQFFIFAMIYQSGSVLNLQEFQVLSMLDMFSHPTSFYLRNYISKQSLIQNTLNSNCHSYNLSMRINILDHSSSSQDLTKQNIQQIIQVKFQQMIQLQIFPNSKEFPIPIYPLLSLILCVALYYALFQFNLQKIIEKLFGLSSNLSHIESTIFYLFLINFPLIVLSIVSVVFNNNLIGFQISCDVDHIQIIIISAYICYVEQSRQTPIRGFLFIRDLITAALCLGTLLYFYYDGVLRLEYGVIIICIYIVHYILQNFEQIMQDKTLRILGIKQNNVYNSQFLLTQTRKQANYLRIKSTIQQNREKIDKQIEQFKQITNRLYSSQDEKQILLNFAKIFLPYKNAVQIQQNSQLNYNIQKICQDWIDSDRQDKQSDKMLQQNSSDGQQDQAVDQKGNQSANCLAYHRTMTDDYVVQQQVVEQQSTFELTVRYIFYPLYYISTLDGRIRYFMDYLCVILLCGCMGMISFSCTYFINITNHQSYCIISLILSAFIVAPSGKYYLRISVTKDFDFINIFIQSSIIKSVIFSILLLVLYIIDSSNGLVGSVGLALSVIVNLVTYCVYGGYMISQKFATRKINLKFCVGLSVCSFFLRIFGELIYNIVTHSQLSSV